MIPALARLGVVKLPRSVVHIGNCPERTLAACGKDVAAAVVTPTLQGASELSAYFADHPSPPTLLHAGIGDSPGSRTFREYNFADLSSFREPTGILKYYPGLRLVRTVPVTQIPFIDVLRAHKLADDGQNLLVLDVGGDEKDLLKHIIDSNCIDHFHLVQVYCGEGSLYAGAPSASTISAILENNTLFRVVSIEDDRRGRLCLTFSLNSAARALKALLSALRPDSDTKCHLTREQRERIAEPLAQIQHLKNALADAKRTSVTEGKARRAAEAKVQELEGRISRHAAEIDRLELLLSDSQDKMKEIEALRGSYKDELLRIEEQLGMLTQLTHDARSTGGGL